MLFDRMKQPEESRRETPIRILLGENDPANAESIQRSFRKSETRAEFEIAGSLREFRDLAAARPPDIALLDENLPGGNALEVLCPAPEDGAFPIVIIAESGDERAAVSALKAGAMDYIVFSPAVFAAMPFVVNRVLREWRLWLERKRSLDALAESEASLQAILQSTADGIVAISRDNRILYYNERFVEMWPIPPGEIAAGGPADVFRCVMDYVVDPEEFMKKIAALEVSLEEEFETIHLKDGRVFDRVSRPLLEGRNHLGRVWSFSDVGEQIRTEAALRDSEETFRQFLINSPIYVFFKDEENRAIRLSKNFETMLGRPIEELLGKEMAELFPVERAGTMTEDDLQILKTGQKVEVDEEIGDRHYATIKFPIRIEGRRNLAGFMIDITDRKLMEKNLRASLREKEVLLQEIHHRVKNNMQVISSLFSIQARQVENQECREILREGQARIRSMSLVHEKLYQSRDFSKIDLPGYIKSLAVHLFQAQLVDPDQVRMETDFEDIALDINTAVPFGLILNELISNALKHGFPKGRKGILKIRLRRGAGGEVILRVADDGVGFQGNLDFRNAESFGLKIINLLVKQLDGVIDLDRTGGTAFIVTFREPKPEKNEPLSGLRAMSFPVPESRK
ncbi:MAG: PAS domain S-box protein [Candidatus Aminicenantes bacterium]|nr:PAS domain S-box protein [Candidatus Aminicenantes bacterium]